MTSAKILGTVIAVSNPKVFKVERQAKADYYHLTVKDDKGREILAYISAASIGLFSEGQSKVYFFDKKTKKLIKHHMVTPARLVHQRVRITGDLRLQQDGYYMSYVRSLVLIA
jgi:hypothetical protein